jgi:hypothetical protein
MYISDNLNGILDPSRKLRRIDTINERGEVFIYIFHTYILYTYIYIHIYIYMYT